MNIEERMRAVLAAEAEAIGAINIDQNFVRAVEVMKACDGKIITTAGIPKATPKAITTATSVIQTNSLRVLNWNAPMDA